MFKLLFKSGVLLQFLVLLVSAGLLWLPAVIHPIPMTHHLYEGPLYSYLIELLSHSPQLSAITAFLLVVTISLLFNYLLIQNDLVSRTSFLTALFYVFLVSWNKTGLYLNPVLPASLFLVASVFALQRMYGLTDAFGQITTASFLVTFAGLFYLPAMLFILFIWSGLLTYRIAGWREWLLSIIGFLLPLLYLFTYYYLLDILPSKLEPLINYIDMTNFHLQNLSILHKVFYILIALMLLITLNVHSANVQDKVIRTRKRSAIIFDYMLAAIVVVVVTLNSIELTHLFLFIPLAFYMGNSITANKRNGSNLDYFYLIFITFIIIIRTFNL